MRTPATNEPNSPTIIVSQPTASVSRQRKGAAESKQDAINQDSTHADMGHLTIKVIEGKFTNAAIQNPYIAISIKGKMGTTMIKFKAGSHAVWNETLPTWDLDHGHITDEDVIKMQVFDKDMVAKGVRMVGESITKLQAMLGYAAVSSDT